MKKMVTIIMIIAMAIGICANAVGEMVPAFEKAMDYIAEFAEIYGYEKELKLVADDDGTLHYCGTLDKSAFYAETGLEATASNWERFAKENTEWSIKTINTKVVGEINGYTVYYTIAEGINNLVWGPNEESYKNVAVLWMICD